MGTIQLTQRSTSMLETPALPVGASWSFPDGESTFLDLGTYLLPAGFPTGASLTFHLAWSVIAYQHPARVRWDVDPSWLAPGQTADMIPTSPVSSGVDVAIYGDPGVMRVTSIGPWHKQGSPSAPGDLLMVQVERKGNEDDYVNSSWGWPSELPPTPGVLLHAVTATWEDR